MDGMRLGAGVRGQSFEAVDWATRRWGLRLGVASGLELKLYHGRSVTACGFLAVRWSGGARLSDLTAHSRWPTGLSAVLQQDDVIS